jgi:uncharacterized DUF497 family protein
MRFEWDEEKNRRNLTKHRISFEIASLVFDDPQALSDQDRVVEGEERLANIKNDFRSRGELVHTFRDEDGEELVRLISARKATAPERRAYAESQERKR